MNAPGSNYDLQVDLAKNIFLEYDQDFLIRKYRLQADERWIYLTYLNIPCRISRESGSIEEFSCGHWLECRNYSTVMTIYDLLCYHRGDSLPELSGDWCTVGNFIVTGIQNPTEFTTSFAARFDGQIEALKQACVSLGGTLEPALAGADITCRIPVMPFLPVLFQFWSGDEEFPPKALLLWDRHANQYLHFETTFYLQGDLFARLSRQIEAL